MVLLIDGVTGILADAGVEDRTIQEILTMLDEAQSQVERGTRIKMAPAVSFGGSATAAELAHHAGKAHHHVLDAMTQMVNGLEGYYRSVEHFRKDVHETDADQAVEFRRRAQAAQSVEVERLLERGAACTQSPTFDSNAVCQLPGEGDGR